MAPHSQPVSWPIQITQQYLDVLAARGSMSGLALALCIALLGLLWSHRADCSTARRRAVLAVFVLSGLFLAVSRLSILDDANYSFRYAENWISGKGLVFNEGERVEGYTNFLWVVLMAAFAKVTPFRVHWIALVLGLVSFLANLLVVSRLGSILHEGREREGWLPIAACFLALHTTFTTFATTGMETMAASLLVNLGLLFLVAGVGPRAAVASGTFFILATLTRPDHSLFWGAGLVVVLIGHRAELAALTRGQLTRAWPGLATIAAFCLPLVPYGLYLLWKLSYYGSILPNSFYARSADQEHVSQGLAYGLTFLLGGHAWLPLAMSLTVFAFPSADETGRVFRRYLAIAVPLWTAYVVWVGGDYIYGRFFVVLLPLLALGAERCVHVVRRRLWGPPLNADWAGAIVGGFLVASAYGLPLIPPKQTRWGIADAPTFTPYSWRNLVEADSFLASRMQYSFQELVDRGLDVSVEGTGGFAYKTHLRVVEACGLLDPEVARGKHSDDGDSSGGLERGPHIESRGHESCLNRDDLVERGVKFSFSGNALGGKGPSPDIPNVGGRPVDQFCGGNTCIHIIAYDKELMNEISREAPSVRFVDFEQYLDTYMDEILVLSLSEVQTDMEFFREYYFRFNDDPSRARRLKKALGKKSSLQKSKAKQSSTQSGMTGFRERLQQNQR